MWAAVLLFLTRFATLCFDRAADHRGRVRALDPLASQGLTRSVLSSWALTVRHGARSGLPVGGIASSTASLAVLRAGRTRRLLNSHRSRPALGRARPPPRKAAP
ncbi:hypothetical protein ACFQ51_21850 [Streptomyces kaempferi]